MTYEELPIFDDLVSHYIKPSIAVNFTRKVYFQMNGTTALHAFPCTKLHQFVPLPRYRFLP